MTPRDAARLRDEAFAIAARFEKIEAQQVPVGGEIGYVLTKSGSGDFAMSWLAPSGGGGSGLSDGDHGDIFRAGSTLSINNGVVGLPKLAVQASGTIVGNAAGGSASPTALTAAQAKSVLAITAADVSGLSSFATGTDAANLTGTLSASRLPAHTGDVTSITGSAALTIGPNRVTRAMMAQTGGAALLGAIGAGSVSDLTPSQAKSLLAITAGDVSGLATVATSGSASDLSTGTIPAARLPIATNIAPGAVPASGGGTVNFLRADFTWGPPPGGGGGGTTTNSLLFNNTGAGAASGTTFNGASAQTVSFNSIGAAAAGPITASQITMASGKLLGRVTAATGPIEELSTLPAANFPMLTGDVSTAAGSLNVVIGANKVTRAMLAQTSGARILGAATAGNVSDLTAAQAKTVLAITASDVGGLASIATSGSAADLTAGTLAAARMPALTGDVTSSAGAVATTIANGAVTLAKQANVATGTLFYRKTAGSGAPEVQTLATLKTDLLLTGTNSGDQQMTAQLDSTATTIAELKADFNALLAKLRSTASGAALMAGDSTAPSLSSPTAAQTGSTTATIGATTNEANGTLYGVVTTSSTAPTAIQVEAGQNHTGSAAVFAGSAAVTSTGAKTINATGLTAATAYYAHLMHKDDAGNRSTVVSSAQFMTVALNAPTPSFTSAVGVNPPAMGWVFGSGTVVGDWVGREYALNDATLSGATTTEWLQLTSDVVTAGATDETSWPFTVTTPFGAGTLYLRAYTARGSGPGSFTDTSSPSSIISRATYDGVPDSWDFTDQTGVATSTLTASAAAVPTGYGGPVYVATNGNEVQILDASNVVVSDWSTANTTISPTQKIKVRGTSSASAGTESTLTISVAGVDVTFKMTTAVSGVAFNPSASQPAVVDTGSVLTYTFTSQALNAGTAVVGAMIGGTARATAVTFTPTGGGTAVSGTMAARTSATQSIELWTSNTPLAAGNWDIKIDYSAGCTRHNIMHGAMLGQGSNTPTDTCQLLVASGNTSPHTASDPLTVPTNGLGIVFAYDGTATVANFTSGGMTLAASKLFGSGDYGLLTTSTTRTPSFTSTTGFSGIIGAAFGP